MMSHLSPNEKLSSVLSAFILSGAVCYLILQIRIAPTYSDFIVGYLAWNKASKFQDLIVIPGVIASFLAWFLYLAAQLSKQRTKLGEVYCSELANQILLWSIPALAFGIKLMMGVAISKVYLFISLFGILFVSLSSFYLNRQVITISPISLSLGLLSILFLSLIPMEIFLIEGRLTKAEIIKFSPENYIKSSIGLLIVAIFLYGVILLQNSVYFQKKLLKKLILLGQLSLLPLCLVLYPAKLLPPDGYVFQYPANVNLTIFVGFFMLCAFFDIFYRYRKHTQSKLISDSNISNLFSPLSIFSLLFLIRMGSTLGPFVSPDDYHFGESLLGWWSYMQGAIPYLDHVPSHGLVQDDMNLALSYFFYDGTVATLSESWRISFFVLSLCAFLSLCHFTKNMMVSVFGVLVSSLMTSFLFLVPFICIFSNKRLVESPHLWLSVYIFFAPFVILGVPSQGLLLILAFGTLAIFQCWSLFKNARLKGLFLPSCVLLLVTFICMITPLGAMLFSSIRYVVENGPINQLAYGVPWTVSWGSSGFIFELTRVSWLVLPAICLVLLCKKFCNQFYLTTQNFIIISLFLFSLLFIPYTMGRIDPGGISRTGSFSLFSWSYLIPIVLWHSISKDQKANFTLIISALCLMLGFEIPSFNQMKYSFSPFINVPQPTEIEDDSLSNVGRGIFEKAHLEYLMRTNVVLKKYLSPGEPYLDLTSHNAHYYYFNRKPLVAITAPYNLVSISQQRREVEKIKLNPPKIVLMESQNIIHDGGGLALRSPLLYKFIFDSYVPFEDDGIILGLRKDITLPPNKMNPNIQIKDLSDENWEHGIHRTEAAFIISNPRDMIKFELSEKVRFSNGEERKVTHIRSDVTAVWVEGPPLGPSIGSPNTVYSHIDPKLFEEEQILELLEKSFFPNNSLHFIPISWGRSQESLLKKMTKILSYSYEDFILHDMRLEKNVLKITGNNPSIDVDISSSNVSGRAMGILKYDIECFNTGETFPMKVEWWSEGNPTQPGNIKFTGKSGTLIIPLDASPKWLMRKRINKIRIAFEEKPNCESIQIDNVGLYQRDIFKAEE